MRHPDAARTIGERLWSEACPGAQASCTGYWVLPIIDPWSGTLVDHANREARYVSGGLRRDPALDEPPEHPEVRQHRRGGVGTFDAVFDDEWITARGADVPPTGMGYQRFNDERVRPPHGGIHSPYGTPDYVLDVLAAYGYIAPGPWTSKSAGATLRTRYRQAVALAEFTRYDTVADGDGVPRFSPRTGSLGVDYRRVFPGKGRSGAPIGLEHVLIHKSAGNLIRLLDTAARHDLERFPYQRGPTNFPPLSVAADLAQPAPSAVHKAGFQRRLKAARELGWRARWWPWALGSDAPGDLGALPLVTADYDWVEDERWVLPLNDWHLSAVAEQQAQADAWSARSGLLIPTGQGRERSMIMGSRALDPDPDAAELVAARATPNTREHLLDTMTASGSGTERRVNEAVLKQMDDNQRELHARLRSEADDVK